MKLKELFLFESLLQESIDYDGQFRSLFDLLYRISEEEELYGEVGEASVAGSIMRLRSGIKKIRSSNVRSDVKQWLIRNLKASILDEVGRSVSPELDSIESVYDELQRMVVSTSMEFVEQAPENIEHAVDDIEQLLSYREVASIESIRFHKEPFNDMMLHLSALLDEWRGNTIESALVRKGDGFTIYKPETSTQSCKLGTGTGWCTSSSTTGNIHFTNYINDGNELYIVHSDSGDKFAVVYSLVTNEVIEVQNRDNTIGTANINSLRRFYKDLKEAGIDPVELVSSFPFPSNAFRVDPSEAGKFTLPEAMNNFFATGVQISVGRIFRRAYINVLNDNEHYQSEDIRQTFERVLSQAAGSNNFEQMIDVVLVNRLELITGSPTIRSRSYHLNSRTEEGWAEFFDSVANEDNIHEVAYDLVQTILNAVYNG